MKFVTRFSPVALHFGSLDTRVLQLTGSPRGWTVRTSETAAAQGATRHSQAATALATRLKGRLLGKDAALATSAAHAATTVVPVEPGQTERLRATLEEAAARAIEDAEGINYRYVPLTREGANAESREEYLLLCLGQSEQRRCTGAGEALGLRPVGLELSAFAVARALTYGTRDEREATGFLHLGFDHAYFGIAFESQMRFLKPMERDSSDLLDAIQKAVEPLEASQHAQSMALGFLTENAATPASDESDDAPLASAATMLARVKRQSEEQGTVILRALRSEAANLALEIRACLRHFHARNPGIAIGRVAITGFGAGLPGLSEQLEQALKIDAAPAQPFTRIGVGAPAEILREQHLWCAPLGLALRDEA